VRVRRSGLGRRDSVAGVEEYRGPRIGERRKRKRLDWVVSGMGAVC
jgi:hypothetical protein